MKSYFKKGDNVMCKGLRKVLKEMKIRKIWGRDYNIMYNDQNVIICSSWSVADYCRCGYRDITEKIKELECDNYFYNGNKKIKEKTYKNYIIKYC